MFKKSWQWVCQHRALVSVGALLLLADRASKVWALVYLASHGPIRCMRYFWLTYVENTGAAFGMFEHGNAILIVVMLAVMAYLIYSWKDLLQQGPLAVWGGVLILTGAVGNLYDRVTLGFVVDFLDFRVWPVFNVADSCITVGAVLLGLCLVRNLPKRQEKL